MESNTLALFLILLGGALQGAFPLPLKYAVRWKWENVWLVYASFAMVLLPWLFTLITIPDPSRLYSGVRISVLVLTALFGFGWGAGHVLYGLGVGTLGIALGPAIILGITVALGSLAPMAIYHPEQLLTRTGMLTIAGVTVSLAGILVCAAAGRIRERSAGARRPGVFAKGVLICIGSGILSALMNFAFYFGQPLVDAARASGSAASVASYPLLAVVLSAGFLANAGYSVRLVGGNGSWASYRAPGWAGQAVLAAIMAAMLYGGYVLYGAGISRLGEFGPTLGWPLFISGIIVTANMVGIWSGEWRAAGRRATLLLLAGSGVLILAVVLLGAANGR